MMTADIVTIGDLILPGQYGHPQRFDHAVNFFFGNRVVSLVRESIGAGPTNVVVAGHAWRTWREAGETLWITRSKIRLGRHTATRQNVPIYASRLPTLSFVNDRSDTGRSLAAPRTRRERKSHPQVSQAAQSCRRRLLQALRHVVKILEREALTMSLASAGSECRASKTFQNTCVEYQYKHIAILLRHLPPQQLVPPQAVLNAVRALAGSGIGATPAGDDFLAGMLLALHVFPAVPVVRRRCWIRALRAAAQTENLLSAHFLDLAAAGCASEDVRRFITSLPFGPQKALDDGVRAVLQHGHTSGADLLCGLVQTLRKLTSLLGADDGNKKRNS